MRKTEAKKGFEIYENGLLMTGNFYGQDRNWIEKEVRHMFDNGFVHKSDTGER